MVLDLTGIQALKLKRQHIRYRSRGPARGGWAQDWPLVAYICFQGLVSSGGIPEPLHVCLLRGILSLLWSLGNWPEPLSVLAWDPPDCCFWSWKDTHTQKEAEAQGCQAEVCKENPTHSEQEGGRAPAPRASFGCTHRVEDTPMDEEPMQGTQPDDPAPQ